MIVERAYAHVDSPDPGEWPWSVPCVRQFLGEGLRFEAPVTFLVGENGSGKSTLVEALAEGFGLDSYGGSADWKYATSRGKSLLGERVRFDAAPRGRRMAYSRSARKGFFLRAETALDALERESLAPDTRSHGEGFLAAFREKFVVPGLYVMDEPEAALSFASCLELLGHIDQLVKAGGQVVCATHSPLLTALPGADIVQVGEDGMERVRWADLELVDHWRRYLADPQAYLRHVLG
ncbi:AAA family ATPase [Streptomyces bacillaris]|uniref:ABC transporter n=1 Tax=Streptomyces rhizosphaericola TaxID=2564098 RepID=A0ABY2P7M4_9ACTN|nr:MULTISPECIES: AAA family ATPase [Streptomyces]ARI53915.1 ABC transporter [Streptomyces sp. S8]MYT92708.1 AAA family ATPase [Streptomyces sp. SID8359]PWS40864.1 ABC transporter [Streptomyces sp. ZEA17I]TGY99407.1 ABC transporter [Streptomyces rhizosphaericola]